MRMDLKQTTCFTQNNFTNTKLIKTEGKAIIDDKECLFYCFIRSLQ